MTILPIIKTCPACHKKYSWNPDVGRFRCPHCGGLGDGKKHFFRNLFEKKKDGLEADRANKGTNE